MANRKSSLDNALGEAAHVAITRAGVGNPDPIVTVASLGGVPAVVKAGRLWGGGEVEVPEDLGKRLAVIRAARKMTQRDLAVHLGKSRTTVNQYEMGNISPPLTVIDQIADALDVDPALLAFGREPVAEIRSDHIWVMQGDKRTDDFADLSTGLQDKFGIYPNESCIIELSSEAPAFKLRRGDQLFIDLRQRVILGDGRLYAVRTGSGEMNLVRPDIQLEGPAERVRITFGHGQISEIVADKVDLIGLVRGTLRLE